ncbi:MAG: antibiotic biosynthesis monooxygenase [Mycobacterium sp.]
MSKRSGDASAVTFFHRSVDAAGFRAWSADLLASAAKARGYLAARVSVLDQPELDWAVVTTFGNEAALHDWLDGTVRAALIADGEGRGFWRRSSDLVMLEGAASPPGVTMFTHTVMPGRESDFEAAQVELTAVSSLFPGYDGTALLAAGVGGDWVSILRFRTAQQLSAWMASRERREALPELRANLAEDFLIVTNTTPFGTTVRTEAGTTLMTPNWKAAMMVLLVLYPTVMLLSRFLGPVLDMAGAQPWLALWLSQVCSVSLMTWWLSPWAATPFRRWLDPVDGRGWRVNVVGASVVLLIYAVTLIIFASIKWLQFWDFMD